MQMILELPEDIANYVQNVAKQTGKNHSEVTAAMLADCMRRNVVKNMHTDSASENAKISPYEVFNFDLERMKKAVESDFKPMPSFDSDEEFLAWANS